MVFDGRGVAVDGDDGLCHQDGIGIRLTHH